jgi:hypothetical protein
MHAIPVVILDVCSQQPLQMGLVDSNQMVQQFAAATAHPTLGHAILSRTPYHCPHCLMLMERITAGTSMLYFES